MKKGLNCAKTANIGWIVENKSGLVDALFLEMQPEDDWPGCFGILALRL